jgi:hypothetical protein
MVLVKYGMTGWVSKGFLFIADAQALTLNMA